MKRLDVYILGEGPGRPDSVPVGEARVDSYATYESSLVYCSAKRILQQLPGKRAISCVLSEKRANRYGEK